MRVETQCDEDGGNVRADAWGEDDFFGLRLESLEDLWREDWC